MLESIDIYNGCYQIIKRKQPKRIVSWITILSISLILFFIIFFTYPYSKTSYYYENIIIEEGEYYVLINLDKTDTKNFVEGTILEVNDRVVKYEIVEMIDNYINNQLLLKLQLKNEPKTILKLKIIFKKNTLFEKLKERIGIYENN